MNTHFYYENLQIYFFVYFISIQATMQHQKLQWIYNLNNKTLIGKYEDARHSIFDPLLTEMGLSNDIISNLRLFSSEIAAEYDKETYVEYIKVIIVIIH